MKSKEKVTIAVQREASESDTIAAREYFGGNAVLKPCNTYTNVFTAVEDGTADFAVVPIENLMSGSNAEIYDFLFMHNVFIIGELPVRIVHCLVGTGNADISTIEKLYAHPEALFQCHDFIKKRHWEIMPVYDIKDSLQNLRKMGRTAAAIASKHMAQENDLKVLKEGIEDAPWNITRYIILSKERKQVTGADKTSIVFRAKHIPGALFACLEGFAKKNINLMKIESRPVKSDPAKFSFFIDFAGNLEDGIVQEAVELLEERAAFVKLLGSYKSVQMLGASAKQS
jgi:prephenate dehydratase